MRRRRSGKSGRSPRRDMIAAALAIWSAATLGVSTASAAGPAAEWRFISGPGVEGAMRLASPLPQRDASSDRPRPPIGHFVLNIAEHGFFEGVYNIREDGASVIGVFWREGDPVNGPIAGVIDIGASPVAPPLAGDEARITLLSGETFNGAQAQ